MNYCELGDKPTVEYKTNDITRKYISPFSPINVRVERSLKNGLGEKYDAQGYTIQFANGGEQTVIKHRTRNNGTEIQYWSCGRADWDNRQPDGTYSVWYPAPPIAGINANKKCPPPIPPQDYVLIVEYENSVIFSFRSDKEITFNVVCGNCPPGHIECKANKYPGYCCIPCQETASKIRNLAAKAGRCNCG